MPNIKVKDLINTTTISLDNQVMVLTNESKNIVQNTSVENFIKNINSTNENNGIITGTDGKLYVNNAPTGVEAGTYTYPKNLVVNEQGKIESVEQGQEADVPLATTDTAGLVKPDNTTISIEDDGTISATGANQDLMNLTQMGNNRLQYAPFAINSGKVLNGQNDTLYSPNNTTSTVTVDVIPKLTANTTNYGTCSIAGNREGYAFEFTTGNSGSNYGQALSWSIDLNENNYIPQDAISSFTITNPNGVDNINQYYGILGLKITYTYTDDTTEVVYDNNSLFTVTGSGPVTKTEVCNPASNTVKKVRVDTYRGAAFGDCGFFTMTYTQSFASSDTIICAPCIITTCDGRTNFFNNYAIIDATYLQGLSDGNYSIFKNSETGELSCVSDFVMSPAAPALGQQNVWLDTSEVPANLKIETDGAYVINNNLVHIGNCTVSSGLVTVLTNNKFNNGWGIMTPQVIERYQNGTSWYRKYSDGWCIQGGVIPSNSGTSGNITFLVPFKNTNYTAIGVSNGTTARVATIAAGIEGGQTTSTIWMKSNTDVALSWVAFGQAN